MKVMEIIGIIFLICVLGFILSLGVIVIIQNEECNQWLNTPVPDGTQWIDMPQLSETYPKTPVCEWRINMITKHANQLCHQRYGDECD